MIGPFPARNYFHVIITKERGGGLSLSAPEERDGARPVLLRSLATTTTMTMCCIDGIRC